MSNVPDIFYILGDLLELSVIEISLSRIFLLKRNKNENMIQKQRIVDI